MFKILKKQIARHPLALGILVFGYIISLLIISIGTTSIAEMKQLALAQTEGSPKNALSINCHTNKNVKFKDYINLFNDIKENSNVRVKGLSVFIENDKKNALYDLNCEFFKRKPEWIPPILKGRYYKSNEILNGNKVVLIGKSLEKDIFVENNDSFINLSGEKYKVLGIVGRKNKKTPWDNNIFMPLLSIPESCQKSIIEPCYLDCIIYNSQISTSNDVIKIKEKLLKINSNSIVNIKELSGKDNIIANTIGSNRNIIHMAFLIFISALLNSINVTSYWINDRRKEIGIRKAFGHTNFNISYMIFSEMLVINFIACILSLILQYMLSLVLGNFYGISLDINIVNFIVGILVTCISATITSIIPIYKSLSIQPVEALKV